MKQMIKPKMGKAVSKGRGISLCRYGGLNIVKQRGNYGNDTFHSAPERHGFYAFPYSFVEMFLVGSTKTKEVKEGTYKKFRAIDGYLWTHLKPARQADIIAQKGSWYKVTVEGYIKALKKDYAHHSSSMYKDFYGEGKIYPNRANPYIITCKDDLEVFITRETIISENRILFMFTDMNQKNKAVENSIDGLEQLNDLSVMGFFMSLHIKSYEGISWFSFFDKLKAPRVKAFVKGLGTEQKVIITFDNDIIAHLCTTEQKMQMVTSAVVYNEEKWNYALNYLLSFISDYQRDCSIVKETQENKLFHSAEPYSGERTLSVLTQAILEEMGVTNQQHELIRFNTSLYDLKLPRIDIKTEFRGHYSNEYASVYFDGEKIGQVISEVVKYSGGYEERQFFTSDRKKWNEMISYIISNIKYEKRLNFVFVVENEIS